jgi:hypothetical protein
LGLIKDDSYIGEQESETTPENKSIKTNTDPKKKLTSQKQMLPLSSRGKSKNLSNESKESLGSKGSSYLANRNKYCISNVNLTQSNMEDQDVVTLETSRIIIGQP